MTDRKPMAGEQAALRPFFARMEKYENIIIQYMENLQQYSGDNPAAADAWAQVRVSMAAPPLFSPAERRGFADNAFAGKISKRERRLPF